MTLNLGSSTLDKTLPHLSVRPWICLLKIQGLSRRMKRKGEGVETKTLRTVVTTVPTASKGLTTDGLLLSSL